MTVEPGVPAFQPCAGQVVGGRYELQHELGRGGMGSVWSARNVSLDAPCAIKFMHSELRGKSDLRRRFMREARAAGQLRSPFIVTVFEVGEWNGWPYMAMELLEGETLERRMERDGKLTPELTLHIVSQIARGLAAAHAAGLVHRDLKPENIFLIRRERADDDEDISVKILDFGVAKHVEATSGVKTAHGALLGTPYYMSPEQVQGDGNIDHRSDVWALGVLTFECLTGRLPFSGTSVGEILIAILQGKIPPIGVPGCERFWMRASQRDPAQRFQTGLELAAALREAIEDDGTLPATPVIQPRPSANVNVQGSAPKRHAWPLALGALVIVVSVGVQLTRSPAPAPARATPKRALLTAQPAVAHATEVTPVVEEITGFSLDSEPSGASVFVDGIAMAEVTPVRFTGIAAGSHSLRVEKPGFRTHTISFVLTAGALLELPKAVLEPQPQPAAQDVQPVQSVQPKSNERTREPAPRPAAEKQAKPRLGKYDDLIGF